MLIAIDPTEATPQSLLPKRLVRAATSVKNFERETSADFLISPLSSPRLPDRIGSDALSRQILKIHCDAGALVQRKSGNDLLASISKLPYILERMKAWCPRNYLLATGSFTPDRNGYVVCNGRTSKWKYNSMMGALEGWVDNGGLIRFLHKDSDITSWLTKRMATKLAMVQDGRAKFIFAPTPKVVSPDKPDWFKNILRMLRGIGPVRADLVGDHCGSLIWSFIFLTDIRNRGKCGVPGPVIERLRTDIGLSENQHIHILEREFK